MSILDSLTGLFSQSSGAQGLLTSVLSQSGGFESILGKLNDAGLGAKVNSWLGNGENQPLTVAELEGALGNQHLAQLAASFGVPMDKVASLLAQHLPAAVDAVSPNGVVNTTT